MTDLIYITQSLPASLCSSLVKKYETDLAEVSSYNISNDAKWASYDAKLFAKLSKATDTYYKKLSRAKKNLVPLYSSNVTDTGYFLQKFPQSNSAKQLWTTDSNVAQLLNGSSEAATSFTYAWFLSEPDKGGGVEFSNGVRVEPKVGQLVLFPAVWTLTYSIILPQAGDMYMCLGNIICGPVEKVSHQNPQPSNMV